MIKLPKKWCIKVYKDLLPEEVYKWRGSKWFENGYIDYSSFWDFQKNAEFVEITLEEFKYHILGERTEYYEFVGKKGNSFTIGKIYKVKNPNELETSVNFIDDNGKANGFAPNNHKKFILSTEEKWLEQEGFIIKNNFYLINLLKKLKIK